MTTQELQALAKEVADLSSTLAICNTHLIHISTERQPGSRHKTYKLASIDPNTVMTFELFAFTPEEVKGILQDKIDYCKSRLNDLNNQIKNY